MMNSKFQQTKDSMNRILKYGYISAQFIKVLRALILSLSIISLWALIQPDQPMEQLSLGLLSLLLALMIRVRDKPHFLEEDDLVLSLEIRHPEIDIVASKLKATEGAADPVSMARWDTPLAEALSKLKKAEFGRLTSLASTLVFPLFISMITLPNAAPGLSSALAEVGDVVARLNRGVSLKVIQGSSTERSDDIIQLSTSSPLKLELISQNLIEVSVKGGGFGDSLPIVELRRPATDKSIAGSSVYQSFQMLPVRGQAGDDSKNNYMISLAIDVDVDLYIPAIDSSSPLAIITVKQLPVPKVTISLQPGLEDPWPDDQPLQLHIKVKAENPLQLVRLVIRSKGRASKETVANIMSEDKFEIDTRYKIVLEPYVQSDIAEVEIIAEAIDRSVPTPLLGVSNVISITTASAYGRYRNTLKTLRELKTHLDESVSKVSSDLNEDAHKTAVLAATQSEKSPFFDGLDRVAIHKFERDVSAIEVNKSVETLVELSSDLNDFLTEHEILDSRERDRDFFVAARGLSRLIEAKRQSRPVNVETVTARISEYLDDRYKFWIYRVSLISPPPPSWPRINGERPFHQSMDYIATLDKETKTDQRNNQLKALSKTVVEYRKWIEELEKIEDEQREKKERKRQQGLASARNVMRELQKRQGKISTKLDKAKINEKEVSESWASTRMKQNTNANETRRVENQVRALAPKVAIRMKQAVKSMEKTVETGNAGNYVAAESSSDLAGRLLRQAQQAANKSSRKRRSRGRRRRVTGDNYYGQSIVGGDVEIKREYQVDRRYREDILNEVLNEQTGSENKALLENYLRQVIR
jgi:hypothetical protein